jgi:hypothetical protein
MNDAKSIPEVPTGVLVLTGGVDVGEKMLNYEVVGWGKGRESWGIEYGILDGDPREEDVWRMLDRAVCHRVFTCSDQKKMRVKRIAIDAGYAADFVYGYVKSRSPRCIATKGIGGLGKPFILGAGTVTKASRVRLQLWVLMPARKKSLIVFAWKSQDRVIVISLNWKMGNQCVGMMKHFLRDSKLNTGKSGTNLVSELTYGRSCQVSGTNRSTAEFWHWLL